MACFCTAVQLSRRNHPFTRNTVPRQSRPNRSAARSTGEYVSSHVHSVGSARSRVGGVLALLVSAEPVATRAHIPGVGRGRILCLDACFALLG